MHSIGKTRKILLSAALIALLVGLWTTQFRGVPDGGDSSRASVTGGVERDADRVAAAQIRSAGHDESAGLGSVVLVVRDRRGALVPGLELTVGTMSGITDHQGELRLDGLEPGLWAVHPPEGWIAMPSPGEIDDELREIDVTPGEQLEHIVVMRDCTGPFRVLSPLGEPLVGARVTNGLGEGVTGPQGETPAVARACGSDTVWIWLEGKVRYLELPVTIPGPELAEINLPADQEAELLLTDAEGQPLSAEIRGLDLHEAETLGAGLYRVSGPVDVLLCGIYAAGYPKRQVHVPLDGERHHVVFEASRDVRVWAACDGPCPERMRCGEQDCEAVQGGFHCVCPQGPATLTAMGSPCDLIFPTKSIAADVSEIHWDLRCGTGSVHGRWSGRTPCTVAVEGTGHRSGTCNQNGELEVGELPPGDYTLIVDDSSPDRLQPYGFAAQQASRQFALEPGQRLDLGLLEPDAGCVQGVVESDQPLDGMSVQATGRSVVAQLNDEGAFMLCGVPLDEDLELSVGSMRLGATTASARAGEYLHWLVKSGLGGLETVQLHRERD